jgi:hypothetical protein
MHVSCGSGSGVVLAHSADPAVIERTGPQPVRMAALTSRTMRSSRTKSPLRLAAATGAAFALLAVSCGDDSGGSTQAFCDLATETDAGNSLDIDTPEGIAQVEQLIETAPDSVKEPLDKLEELASEFSKIDENDPEAFTAAFELFADPEFLGAVKDVSIFFADQCGIEIDGIDEIRELDPNDPDALLGNLEPEESE